VQVEQTPVNENNSQRYRSSSKQTVALVRNQCLRYDALSNRTAREPCVEHAIRLRVPQMTWFCVALLCWLAFSRAQRTRFSPSSCSLPPIISIMGGSKERIAGLACTGDNLGSDTLRFPPAYFMASHIDFSCPTPGSM
jgi:hypothetical protein